MIDAPTYRRFARDPAAFRDSLMIEVGGEARRLGEIMDPWQRRDFSEVDPALLRVLGRLPKDAPEPRMRAYFERPRGHSKTSDLAVLVTYMLAFAPRPLRLYAYAADRDQAGLLRDACQRIVRANPWLADLIRVDREAVVNIAPEHPGYDSSLRIESSDVGGSFGILPDALIFDEVTHWVENAERLWESLISSAAKKSTCLMLGIANAGFDGTWQRQLRDAIAADPSWIFRRLDGPRASWIDPARLDEQRRLLPSSAFLRLWMNEWSSGESDPALPSSDVAAAFAGALPALHGSEPAYAFCAGLDLGVSRDHSAVVVLGVRRPEHRDDATQIRLAHIRRWRPAAGGKIDLMDVEEELRRVVRRYRPTIGIDPWQAELLAQRLSYDGADVRHVTPTAANLREQATRVREVFTDRRIRLRDEEGLRDDVERLRIRETSYGHRLESPRDKRRGHGDAASALCCALSVAGDVSGQRAKIPHFL